MVTRLLDLDSYSVRVCFFFFFFQAEDGIRDLTVTGVQTCALPILGDARCPSCGGRGVRRAVDPVSVTIPAGVDSGSQMRVRGEGSAGPFGGPRGDLIVSTRVQEHPFFERKGDSIHCEIPISVWEAILGARIRVPTPSGEAVLVIPSGTTGGQVLRLRGQGLPKLSGEAIGDLHVTVRIEIPTGLDSRTHRSEE